MGMLAVASGALIVAFGLLTTRHAPSDAQFGTEITCLVGGLVLIFLGLTLRRLDRLVREIGEAQRHRPSGGAVPAVPQAAPPEG